jgi:hypothetical protein
LKFRVLRWYVSYIWFSRCSLVFFSFLFNLWLINAMLRTLMTSIIPRNLASPHNRPTRCLWRCIASLELDWWQQPGVNTRMAGLATILMPKTSVGRPGLPPGLHSRPTTLVWSCLRPGRFTSVFRGVVTQNPNTLTGNLETEYGFCVVAFGLLRFPSFVNPSRISLPSSKRH